MENVGQLFKKMFVMRMTVKLGQVSFQMQLSVHSKRLSPFARGRIPQPVRVCPSQVIYTQWRFQKAEKLKIASNDTTNPDGNLDASKKASLAKIAVICSLSDPLEEM